METLVAIGRTEDAKALFWRAKSIDDWLDENDITSCERILLLSGNDPKSLEESLETQEPLEIAEWKSDSLNTLLLGKNTATRQTLSKRFPGIAASTVDREDFFVFVRSTTRMNRSHIRQWANLLDKNAVVTDLAARDKEFAATIETSDGARFLVTIAESRFVFDDRSDRELFQIVQDATQVIRIESLDSYFDSLHREREFNLPPFHHMQLAWQLSSAACLTAEDTVRPPNQHGIIGIYINTSGFFFDGHKLRSDKTTWPDRLPVESPSFRSAEAYCISERKSPLYTTIKDLRKAFDMGQKNVLCKVVQSSFDEYVAGETIEIDDKNVTIKVKLRQSSKIDPRITADNIFLARPYQLRLPESTTHP